MIIKRKITVIESPDGPIIKITFDKSIIPELESGEYAEGTIEVDSGSNSALSCQCHAIKLFITNRPVKKDKLEATCDKLTDQQAIDLAKKLNKAFKELEAAHS